MAEDTGFEPYIDWDGMTDEMVDEFHETLVEFRKYQDEFIANKSKKSAANVLRLQMDISNIAAAIHQTLFTIPMMVHIAGAQDESVDDDGNKQIFQRCKRCGSVLQMWRENIVAMTPNGIREVEPDDMKWWEEDQIVAKTSDEDSMTMYAIDKDQKLEAHEKPCPDFASELG
jgi:Zn ribbon nucleic-acid-binding protein